MRPRKLEHQALRGRWAAITYQVLSGFLARAVVALLVRLPICFAALAALAPLPLQLPCRLQPPPFAARPRPRLFGSNRAAAAHCATSDLGGQPRAPRALPLLLSCSPHPKLRPVALYDRALALPCPIAPFRPPASRLCALPRPAAGPPAHRAHRRRSIASHAAAIRVRRRQRSRLHCSCSARCSFSPARRAPFSGILGRLLLVALARQARTWGQQP